MHASHVIRRLFALPKRRRPSEPVPGHVVWAAMPEPGQLTLIGGGSGGGKSRLLHALKARAGPGVRWIEPAKLSLGRGNVVDRMCDELESGTGGSRIEMALELLSRVGLAEAWTYLQTPAELSDGQRWRLRLALAVARALKAPPGPTGEETVTVLAIDEFAALLDRVTARVVARALRRLVDRPGRPRLAAIVATSHDDLRLALAPDRTIVADFGLYRIAGEPVRETHERETGGVGQLLEG
jgi:hypothetical protein